MIKHIKKNNYNYILGATGAYVVGHLHYDWKKIGDIIFTIGTFVLALLLFSIYYCNTLWILYVLYITFGTFYQVLSTITTYEINTDNIILRVCKCKYSIRLENYYYIYLVIQTFLKFF